MGLKPLDTVEDPKKFAEFENSTSLQLKLFEFIQPQNKQYSNTIELYDFLPKYVWGKVARINDQFLESLEREFEYRNVRYKITIEPARLKARDGKTREFFPGKREELVEDALRRLLTSGKGVFLDEEAGIIFSLYELQKELKENKHTYSYDELKDAIRILNGTRLIIKNGKKLESGFSPVANYGFAGEDGETQSFVRFSPLVTRSIKQNTYRLVNYSTLMAYKSVIARQLHKRISHLYVQANTAQSYNILLSTLIRDFGLKQYKRIDRNLDEVIKALEEMKTARVLASYQIEKTLDASRRAKMIDAKLILVPHPVFVSEAKHRNKRHSDNENSLSEAT